MKNYYTTAGYLKEFVRLQYKSSDIYLSELDYCFISRLEHFPRKRQPDDHQKKLDKEKKKHKPDSKAVKATPEQEAKEDLGRPEKRPVFFCY